MGQPDLSKILDLPEQTIMGWHRYYSEEPWDAPAQAVAAFGRSREGVSGDDAEAAEAAFRAFAGGR